MSLRIQIELNDNDLKYFKNAMRETQRSAEKLDDHQVTEAATRLLQETREANVPDFISERIATLEVMVAMVHDEGWKMPDEERERVISALAYFAEADDMIPDDIPVVGFLDDAIMIELVVRELKHELDAYEDFCTFRQAEAVRLGKDAKALDKEGWLDDRRKQLHSRMRRRRGAERGGRSRRRGRSRGGRGTSFSLW